MGNMNMYLFDLLNAGSGLSGWPLYFAIAAAEYLIYVIPIGLVVGWLWSSSQYRSTILAATFSRISGLGHQPVDQPRLVSSPPVHDACWPYLPRSCAR